MIIFTKGCRGLDSLLHQKLTQHLCPANRRPSMGPEFRNGEVIVGDPERAETNGNYVLTKRKEDNSVTFKQLIVTEGKKYLKAVNPEWPNRIIEVDGEWQICGVVIYSHRVYI